MNISENGNLGLLSFIMPREANGLQLMNKMEIYQPSQRQIFAPSPAETNGEFDSATVENSPLAWPWELRIAKCSIPAALHSIASFAS